VSTPPSDVPPPPQTQIVGQQASPSSTVPHTPGLQPQGAGTAGQTNTLAVVSLVAGIGSFFAHIIPGVGGFTVALVAAITGYMARNQIKQTGESGYGMATAGMIIGIVHMALIVVGVVALILIFIFGIALFGIAASHSSG
jgi:uncharacterized protein DUF4190